MPFSSDVKWFLLSVLVLYGMGTWNLFMATKAEAALSGAVLSGELKKHLLFSCVAVLVIWGSQKYGYFSLLKGRAPLSGSAPGEWFNQKPLLMLLSLVVFLALGYVLLMGERINGAKRWIDLGFFSFQPSEFAKITAVIWAGIQIVDWKRRPGPHNLFVQQVKDLPSWCQKCVSWAESKWLLRWLGRFLPWPTRGPWIVMSVPIAFISLILLEPDFGTSILTVLFPALMLLLSGLGSGDGRRLIVLGILAVIGFFWYSSLKEYSWARIETLIDPWRFEQGSGYQTVQSMIAVGTGGFTGMKGEGAAKYFYLPEAHTDFAFAIWAQETGFVGVAIALLAVLAMIFFGYRIAVNCKDQALGLVTAGLVTMLGFQCMYNTLMVIGWIFVTGIAFPFFSYGGTLLLTNSIIIGMIMLAGRRSKSHGNPAPTVEGPSMREETRSRFRPNV